MKRPKTRRKPRWTTADTTQFDALAVLEATSKTPLSHKDHTILERLDRKRRSLWLYSIDKDKTHKRFLRRVHRRDIALAKKFQLVLDQYTRLIDCNKPNV